MSSLEFTMVPYRLNRSLPLVKAVIECADEFRQHFGVEPTVGHVSILATELPPALGVLRLEKFRDVFAHEVHLGPVPEVPPVEPQAALSLNAERPAAETAERPVDTNSQITLPF